MSTSQSTARRYHHGDLRAALLGEGLRLVEEAGAEALSLREVARAAGVSATAVYRHFPDKRALMMALAQEGVRRLGAAQTEAAAGQADAADGFGAIGRAYVRFALANPGLFRLTFTYPGLAIGDPMSDAAATLLHDYALGLAAGNEARARIIGVRAWSLVHGLAMLMLDGRVPDSDVAIDAVIDIAAIYPKPGGD